MIDLLSRVIRNEDFANEIGIDENAFLHLYPDNNK